MGLVKIIINLYFKSKVKRKRKKERKASTCKKLIYFLRKKLKEKDGKHI